MALISITRLRLRSLRYFPSFAVHLWGSTRQIRRAPGFIVGQFATEGVAVFWTITAWTDEAAMHAYWSSGSHLKAMPKLLGWCDEASVTHWMQQDTRLPGPVETLERMVAQGRLSKVRHPSPGQAAGLASPDRTIPRAGPPLRPITRAA